MPRSPLSPVGAATSLVGFCIGVLFTLFFTHINYIAVPVLALLFAFMLLVVAFGWFVPAFLRLPRS